MIPMAREAAERPKTRARKIRNAMVRHRYFPPVRHLAPQLVVASS